RLAELDPAAARVDHELTLAAAAGARLVTVLDDDYPANLRPVRDLPPFLFLLGDNRGSGDVRSVAVVGTRHPTAVGLDRAARWAEALVSRGVTVVSGLAKGVDAAAHDAALRMRGRTVAVIGTGISRIYPPEHVELSQRIAATGAVVSPFWPSMAPARWSFPRRNAVMAGISQATLVIEASATSGAKLQARLAHEQSKGVFLIPELVEAQEWARRYLDRGWAGEVGDVEELLARLPPPQVSWQTQMTLDLT
ncbi:MAG TPA: DNA-processing protein DprA, partial [Acidimicrobiales bacterium]|nr:DNA-processing protein DprA [Acidimicrobiales bacterium]